MTSPESFEKQELQQEGIEGKTIDEKIRLAYSAAGDGELEGGALDAAIWCYEKAGVEIPKDKMMEAIDKRIKIVSSSWGDTPNERRAINRACEKIGATDKLVEAEPASESGYEGGDFRGDMTSFEDQYKDKSRDEIIQIADSLFKEGKFHLAAYTYEVAKK